jgi:hypothetical protein
MVLKDYTFSNKMYFFKIDKVFFSNFTFEDTDKILKLLSGDQYKLIHLFCWEETLEGHTYWMNKCSGRVPLTEDEKTLFRVGLNLPMSLTDQPVTLYLSPGSLAKLKGNE